MLSSDIDVCILLLYVTLYKQQYLVASSPMATPQKVVSCLHIMQGAGSAQLVQLTTPRLLVVGELTDDLRYSLYSVDLYLCGRSVDRRSQIAELISPRMI